MQKCNQFMLKKTIVKNVDSISLKKINDNEKVIFIHHVMLK